MTRVLIDGRIAGHDGIGRYTTCLVQALRTQAGADVTINVLHPTGTPRYSRAKGTELLEAARACRADIVHLLNYRVPLKTATVPLMVTIHDILRLAQPQFCYSDEQFTARFGAAGLAELATVTSALHRLTNPPQGARPATECLPRSAGATKSATMT